MVTLITGIAFIIGILLGLLLGKLLGNKEVSAQRTRADLLQQQCEEKDKKLTETTQQLLQISAEKAGLASAYQDLQQRLAEQKQDIENQQKQFEERLQNLVNQFLKQGINELEERNKKEISSILNPLKDDIGEFKKRIEQINESHISQHASLKEQLTSLQQLNQQMNEEARNLTQALKGDSKTMGTWGEILLERVLELSGLKKGREYEVQQSFEDDEAQRKQPDVIVYLPDNRCVIIDAKVSLAAYDAYVSASDESSRGTYLKQHITSVRHHVEELSKKDYAGLRKLNSLDFVLMFIPVEPAFTLAMQEDRQLFDEAFGKRVVIVTPSTLLATLRTIENMWRYEKQYRNAQEIARLAKTMLEKFKSFYNELENIEKRLNQAKDALAEAKKKLSDGRGSIISHAQKLVDMGISPKHGIPSVSTEIPALPESDDDMDEDASEDQASAEE